MKDQINIRFILLAFLSVFIIVISSSSAYSQNKKKNRARINVEYVKIMGGRIHFDIKASARINKKTVPVSDIELTIYNEIDEDNKLELGKTKTNKKGETRFSLKNINAIRIDSTNTYNISVSFNGNESFNKAKKSIHFKDAHIDAKIMTKDSTNFITAILTDAESKNPIEGQFLNVNVQRLFRALRIGEEFNETDEEGSITIPIDQEIPGVDGNLIFEVVLSESDDYGTIKALVESKIGIPIVDESTFDQRTMWSPRGKTPIFLLFLTYSGVFVVWGIIVYLIINLYKILKS